MLPSSLALVVLLATPTAAPPARSAPAPRPAPSATALPQLVLVLPFAPEGPADPDWLSSGIAAYVAEGLELAGYRTVDSEAREDAVQDVGLAEEPHITIASACEIARRVGARYVVTGTWKADASRVDVSARFIDVQRLHIVHVGNAGGHISTMPAVLGQLVLAVAGDQGRSATARPAIESLATTKPDVLMAWMQGAAEPEAAGVHLKAALDSDPAFAPALLDLAEARLAEGKPEDVPKILASVPQGGPESRRSRLRLLEGRALLALGDRAGAITALNESVRLSPQPDRLLWLAEAQLASGQTDAAQDTARRVLSIVPDDQHALDIIEPPSADESPAGGPATTRP